jgi:hypothetical protein
MLVWDVEMFRFVIAVEGILYPVVLLNSVALMKNPS